jgi:hypothetical protein
MEATREAAGGDDGAGGGAIFRAAGLFISLVFAKRRRTCPFVLSLEINFRDFAAQQSVEANRHEPQLNQSLTPIPAACKNAPRSAMVGIVVGDARQQIQGSPESRVRKSECHCRIVYEYKTSHHSEPDFRVSAFDCSDRVFRSVACGGMRILCHERLTGGLVSDAFVVDACRGADTGHLFFGLHDFGGSVQAEPATDDSHGVVGVGGRISSGDPGQFIIRVGSEGAIFNERCMNRPLQMPEPAAASRQFRGQRQQLAATRS